MALDNAQYISELSPTDPLFNGPLGQSDDHIRTVKRATQQSFPNVDKAVTTTADEFNFVDGVTSSIQTQLDDANTAIGLRATTDSPVLTGDPQAPTPTTADDDTSIATTAYVKANRAELAALKADLNGSLTEGFDVASAGTSETQAIRRTDRATDVLDGTIRVRLAGTILFMTNDGTNP